MANNFLILASLAAFGWIFISGSPPSIEPTAGRPASRVSATLSSAGSYVTAEQNPTPEARRDPVPIVRNIRVPSASSSPTDKPAAGSEQPAQDDLDRRAAKAAVEADGYKRVTVLGKAGNGAWRAKGYRGTTEVLLTVDGTGRVSMD
jgi:hypothetical protein